MERGAGLAVDYLGFGPILPTRSKEKPEPCVGFKGLTEVCEISSKPVVAIGGLEFGDALRCIGAGAAGAAVIGALVADRAEEVRRRAGALASALRAAVTATERPAGR